MSGKLEFLSTIPIFRDFLDDELAALGRITQEYAFENGAVIAYQRDVADSLHIVREGRLFAKSVDEQGIVRDSRSYLPGDYFGEEWLFAPASHPATVRAKGNGRLFVIESSDFLAFLNEHPQAMDALEPTYDQSENLEQGLSPDAWEEVEKLRRKTDEKSAAVSLLPDELVEYQSRRSYYYLLFQLAIPGILLLLVPTITYFLLQSQFDNPWLVAIPPALLAFILLLWLGFRFLDWRNDYFMITNKHLIHREFELNTFRINVVKVPIGQVQSVSAIKPSFITNLLNLGTARITTASYAGTIFFDNIDDPKTVEQTLNRLRRRVQELDAGREQAVMRASVERHFHTDTGVKKVEEAADPEEIYEQEDRESFWERLWRRYRWRVEDGDTVTYHKHIFVLLRESIWPFLILLLLGLISFLLLRFFDQLLNQLALLILLSALIVDLAWFIWKVEDWRNDTFQVTSREVIDVDRKPFGFGEIRRQAPIGNVQNVSADRPGFLPTLFDFGNVFIETAGVDADITFENVPKPSVIQSDIFKHLDAFRQQQQFKEGERRRREYAVLLDVYKQELEQDRIPRRTPPPGEFGLES
jgi:CRP-like cAMP-binding protein